MLSYPNVRVNGPPASRSGYLPRIGSFGAIANTRLKRRPWRAETLRTMLSDFNHDSVCGAGNPKAAATLTCAPLGANTKRRVSPPNPGAQRPPILAVFRQTSHGDAVGNPRATREPPFQTVRAIESVRRHALAR